jgi:hypothetical protein
VFTVFLCTYRVLCSSVHQYIQFVFFVAFAFGGEGKGRREEGGGSDNWKELHQKVEEGAVVHVCHILSFGKISLLACLFTIFTLIFTHFFPFFPIFKEKMKKKSI